MSLPEHLQRHFHAPERRAHLHPLHRALHLLKHLPRDLHAYGERRLLDRKSTRLNSSHSQISYAVFCLKKKKNIASTSLYPTFLPPGPTPTCPQSLHLKKELSRAAFRFQQCHTSHIPSTGTTVRSSTQH